MAFAFGGEGARRRAVAASRGADVAVRSACADGAVVHSVRMPSDPLVMIIVQRQASFSIARRLRRVGRQAHRPPLPNARRLHQERVQHQEGAR
ncbi:hypothetical protein EJB05_25976, partial [Eragrostis curvula]